MIDRRIYYCWFGKSEKSELNKKCIASWKQFCPNYEIVEINEDNFDYTISEYAIEGYEKGNWSAVSNTARLEIFKNGNGFYLDTDVQLLKSLDELRDLDGGFISEFNVGQPDSGILGCGNSFPWLYEMAEKDLVKGSVLHKNFIRNLYQKYNYYGQSKITYDDDFTILGEEYFPSIRFGFITDKTIGIHYFENTWTKNLIKITDTFYPFPKVEVYIKGKLIHKDKDATVRLMILNHTKKWNDQIILGRINYLFNPKVIRIQMRDFIAERINNNKINNIKHFITAGGAIVSYTDDKEY